MSKQDELIISMPRLDRLINKKFIPVWNSKDRYLVLYGSRGSSKSDFVAKNVIIRMLTHKFFRCVVVRKVERTISGSVFANLKMNINKMGLSQYFKINENPMKIQCLLNNNTIMFRGMDEPEKIKSIAEITCLWWEEEIDYSEDEYITVATSMRAPKADFIQEIFTINPVIPDYENHWFWKKFFRDEDELSFRKRLVVEFDGRIIEQYATVLHSTYRDNRWLKPDFIADMERLKTGNPYTYQTQALGTWAQKMAVGRFYKDFDLGKHTVSSKEYNSDMPIHLSFDFNNNPYSACTVYQVYEKKVFQIMEICLKSPRNKLTEVLDEVCKLFADHQQSVYIYGDPNGYKEDTIREKGDNAYRMIFGKLTKFKPIDRTTRSAPSVRARQLWLNDVLAYNKDNIEITIGMNCRNSINDFTMLREDPSKGGKLKEKGVDNETGINSEKYGHTSDTFEYFMCQYFKDDFDRHKNGGFKSKISYGLREKHSSREIY